MRHKLPVLFAVGVAISVAFSPASAHACKSDTDCKGDRVCDGSKCVAPAKEPAPSSKPAKPPKVVKSEPPSVAPESAAAAPVEESSVPARTPPEPRVIAPWPDTSHVITGTVNFVGGHGVRFDDNVYYGWGVGIQAGILTKSRVYFGMRAHEYVTNRKEIPNSLYTIRAEGRTSYYAVEIGGDAIASRLVVLRLLFGVGLLRSQGTATISGFGPEETLSVEKTTLALEPGAALWFRPSANWFLGPQLGILAGFEDNELGLGAVNLTVGGGYAW